MENKSFITENKSATNLLLQKTQVFWAFLAIMEYELVLGTPGTIDNGIYTW